MHTAGKTLLVLLFTAGLLACSEHSDTDMTSEEGKHFMSEKMQTIKKAEAVEQLVQDAADKQRRRIDEESK